MALSHYSLQARKHWKAALQKQTAAEASYAKERKQRRQLQSKVQELQQQVETSAKGEAELKMWEKRKPMISRKPSHHDGGSEPADSALQTTSMHSAT